MKRKLSVFFALIIVCLLFLSGETLSQAGQQYLRPPVTGESTDDSLDSAREPITKELISMMNHNPELKQMLIDSIAKAKQINPDVNTNPAQTLEQYYDFIDWASKAKPWNVLTGLPYPKLYEKIDQSIDYFYFINDVPLDALKDKGYYNNSLQYVEPYRSWMINFIQQWGQYLNTTDSWSDEDYKIALADERFNLGGDTYESPSNWKTFNQFFARYLSDPSKRPIASPDDDSVFVSPADSQPQGVWKIEVDGTIIGAGTESTTEGVDIKSGVFTKVQQLLKDSIYKDEFNGGTLTHTFLDVNDYHRYHIPVSGTIKEFFITKADDAAGGLTVWDKEKNKYMLLARKPGWQNIETRGGVIIETEKYGLVAVMPIGMSQISSVNFEDTIARGAQVKKGDMLGCFLFGGSDIVMLFQKDVKFELTAKQSENGSYEHINVGCEYGRLSK